jgi:hypothetical protein
VQTVLSKPLGQWDRRQCGKRFESPDAPSLKCVQYLCLQSEGFNWQRAQAPSFVAGIDDRDPLETTGGIVCCIRITGEADVTFKAE